jgi:hemerythrin-like domain-containing protein
MRIDLYTHVHKKQRKGLFALSSKVGEANFTDSATVTDIYNDLILMTNELREHAFHEETFIHPLLERKIPRSERALHHEHVMLKKYLADLETNYRHLQMLTPHYKKSQEQGLEFYRLLNRFIATYLTHIDAEEYVIQNLWEIAVDAELTGIMIAFQTYDGTEKGQKWLATHLPMMNSDEQQLMFKTAQMLAPENIFITMCQLAENILGHEKWQQILKGLS